jgi:outer membrane lipase/esterase
VRGLNYSFGDAATQADRLLYTQALWSDLHAAGVNFIPSDGNAMRRAVAALPAAFGFQFADAAHPACTQPGGVTTAWALLCSSAPGAPSTLVTPDADRTRLFADDQHFTAAGQKIIADYEYSLVVAPSEISYLAEVPVKTRAGIINAIRNQIPLSFDQAGKFHAWVTGDLSWLKMSSNTGFPDDPGTPVAITAGFDYRLTTEWLVGGAISAGFTRQTFSLGGDFKDDELAVSLYGAYRNAPYWFNAVASAGAMHYDTNRQVPIGITVQPNTASTWGTNISFAAEAGYDFRSVLGAAPSGMPVKAPAANTVVTHGPLIGIVLQRVSVNGFTETDQLAAIGGFTALSFDRQIRNSAVGEFGYQASVDVGKWQPFARAVWNHEFADPDRLVTASLTTVAAPSFSLPAVQLGTDWATGIAGTRLKIGDGTSAFAAVVSTFAQHRVTNFGGQIGISVALQ